MRRDDSREVDTVAPGRLASFVGELVDAGFNPVGDETTWSGPIDRAFNGLTSALTMKIVIRDGWPFLHPKVFVDGLGERLHVNAEGDVCLWEDGDDSYAWMTLEGLRARIGAWCDEARAAEKVAANASPDTHLYFQRRSTILATIDVSALQRQKELTLRENCRGVIGATIQHGVARIERDGPVRVRWYFAERVSVPPRDLDAILAALPAGLEKNLARALARLADQVIILLLWNTANGVNALAVLVNRKSDGGHSAEALEVAFTDAETLKLRAGTDSKVLAPKRVACFGLGAIGSSASLLLAKSGIGSLCLVDGEKLRPADVTRHGASRLHVGRRKAEAVARTIEVEAPWCSTKTINESPWDPEDIDVLVNDVDLVIEATGSRAFAEQLSVIVGTLAPSPTLLSVALYRGGAVARVQVQVPGGRPLHERTPANGFSVVPPDNSAKEFTWESGCGAPVNNAPPTSVASAAALAVRTAVDLLVGRMTESADVYEIYSPLEIGEFRLPSRRIEPA